MLGGELEFLCIESAFEEIRRIQHKWLETPEDQCLQWHDISHIATDHAGLTPVEGMERARSASFARCPGVGWEEKIQKAQDDAVALLPLGSNTGVSRDNACEVVRAAVFPSMFFSGCNDHKVALDAGWIAGAHKKIELEFMQRAVEMAQPGAGKELNDEVPGFKLMFGRAPRGFPFHAQLELPTQH